MIDEIDAALGGNGPEEARLAAALRLRVELQPVAGPGARVMPPTYSADENGKSVPKYAVESRRLDDGELHECALLSSTAAEAHKLTDGLDQLNADGAIKVPDVQVNQREFGTHSALQFSHRIFDSWCEDALLEGEPFGKTELYERLSSVINRGVSLPFLEVFPAGLLLGCWASRKPNPQGTTRIARAITSEIIAIDAVEGIRTASKVDIHHVSNAIRLTVTGPDEDRRFGVLPPDADPKKADLLPPGKGKGEPGRPSIAGYGNIVPTFADHGGITMSRAIQFTVVSLNALRNTRAQELGSSEPSDPKKDLAARRMLAALALTMLEGRVEQGWDLRSGCHLVPEAEPTLELVGRLGNTIKEWPLMTLNSADLLAEAVEEGKKAGLNWDIPPLELEASPEQLELLRRSLGLIEEQGEES